MFEVSTVGDRGLRIQFGETISPDTNQQVRIFCMLLEKERITGVVEWLPTYTAISIFYDPYVISYDILKQRVLGMKDKIYHTDLPAAEVIHIPVCYGGEMGPDLLTVAEQNGLDERDVISIHSNKDYLIYMIGFTPGFPYLGGMSDEIATPRLSEPRPAITPGSVGIADQQTGIYSMETPGGWQLIGRTPLKLYDPTSASPILLQAGNYIRFFPVSMEEYKTIEQNVQNGSFTPHTETLQEK
ncbi:inhibitor of KinA [Virgibacillus natechei]|uniref:Inhibitor of KinA n=1 Tax=Virgibacillus natechei TaxID=1216297 RepID=A0ABS4IJL0_9BACI|nr:5-oxoprolinase subunit PxpB [Virgibacillus natechei]MBP1971147.1 inhibitor of KinA [Virgibacillus natechei]UZD12169.1 5-oxoprolinase subunit PxpB [Virgibacillus natechei]